MPRARKNFTGEKFGRLTVLARSDRNLTCRCSCGGPNSENVRAQISNILSGKTKSCGCLREEYVDSLKTGKRKKDKSDQERVLERLFYNMRSRCNYAGDPSYPHYGQVGITVCPEWSRKDAFLDWAIPRYTRGDTLALYTPTQYNPDNCVFVPRGAGVVHGVIKAVDAAKLLTPTTDDGVPLWYVSQVLGVPLPALEAFRAARRQAKLACNVADIETKARQVAAQQAQASGVNHG